jgi:hypothetical protein
LSPLDGNTILNIFGGYLFDGVQKCNKPGFEQGKAEAIVCLCKIFCIKKVQLVCPSSLSRTLIIALFPALKVPSEVLRSLL